MNDILPQQTAIWQYLESTMAKVTSSYGYGEIRTPIVEHVELFKRSIGEVTDIIEKEMYILSDRNGEMLALRPEGTASIVRAGQEHGLLYNQTQRFWYKGPMFRYEKPQKGRYRQFQQLGVESFGMAGADIDAEVILLCASLWRELGILDSLTLELNSIGSNEARKSYREALVNYLADRKEELDPDSQKRLASNPLRILDSKDAKTQQILDDAPSLTDYLDDDSRQHFSDLCSILEGAGIQYVVNPRLVRGLDYYCKTVFEWTTDKLGAQGTVCAGGRYDGLVEQLGGRATPGVGMAMGAERLILLLETLNVVPSSLRHSFDYYLAAQEKGLEKDLILLAERLRRELPSKRIKVHCAGLKNIASKAKQTGASKIVLLNRSGDQLSASVITDEQTQHDINVDQLVNFL